MESAATVPQMKVASFTYDEALSRIEHRAQSHDLNADWPALDLADLHSVGALQWAVSDADGKGRISALELHLRYERLATASLATALIVTQRDAAVGLIDAATASLCRTKLLGDLLKNDVWATVGIAQLSTSRQRGRPALAAHRIDGGYLLNGEIPWCTGAVHSAYVVAGATLQDGQQILFVLQQGQQGIALAKPMHMVALNCALTSAISLENVVIDDAWLLQPPCRNPLSGRRNSLALGQTFLATGLTQACLNLIAQHSTDRAHAACKQLNLQLASLRDEVQALCRPGYESEAAAQNARLRGACNDLAVRSAQVAVAVYKGAALLDNHPAQRLAREAMFLLVWSCPDTVIDCTVDLLCTQRDQAD